MASNVRQLPYRYLGGQCGLKVSTLCFGTMTFGQVRHDNCTPPATATKETLGRLLHAFRSVGREGVGHPCDLQVK